MEEFTVFDLKLKDGRYFSNVIISDWSGACYSIQEVLDNYYYTEKGIREDLEMSAWDSHDEDCFNELCTFHSKDIEYATKAYKNK